MNERELKAYIAKQYQGIQPYQTVEFRGKIIHRGTERCWLSWENIEKLGIDWKGKKVLDVGSYFGFFSTKVLRSGAKEVVALDQKQDALAVCRTVLTANGFNNFQTIQRRLDETESRIPGGFDVTLVLNCLHHIKSASGDNFDAILGNLFSSAKEIVFEVNQTNIEDVKKIADKSGCELVKQIKSHRKNKTGSREILHFRMGSK